jgi:L-2,4-diaminobutyric acid acetyltransferase
MEMFRKALPSLRKPSSEDGAAIWALIQDCKPLDENSMYCNLIQCDHFRDTCIVAELDGEVVGWVSGYILPHDVETLFVWQVAVSEKARGTGLGTLMLRALLSRDLCKDVTRVQTTITRDNAASWALFRKFSDLNDGELSSTPYFSKSLHFNDLHDTEYMVTIAIKERMKKAA